jgi:hypothetical protein
VKNNNKKEKVNTERKIIIITIDNELADDLG